jgi:hypothetical protein
MAYLWPDGMFWVHDSPLTMAWPQGFTAIKPASAMQVTHECVYSVSAAEQTKIDARRRSVLAIPPTGAPSILVKDAVKPGFAYVCRSALPSAVALGLLTGLMANLQGFRIRAPEGAVLQRRGLVVCKGLGFSLRALDAGEDLVGVLGPGERPGLVVPAVDERADGGG